VLLPYGPKDLWVVSILSSSYLHAWQVPQSLSFNTPKQNYL